VTVRNKAYIVGAFEHPLRLAPDHSTPQLHAECARGALADAGLSLHDVDGYFCAGDAPGFGAMSMVDYLGITPRHIDSTETGGSSYILHVGHAAAAIAAGKCSVALITLAGRPRSEPFGGFRSGAPESGFESWVGASTQNSYAMCAARHMHEFGTTSEQLAWIKVAASHHARHNPNAMLRDVVTGADVLASPMIADPLHRLDCCVVSDGGGALLVVSPGIARSLARPLVAVRGATPLAVAVRTQSSPRRSSRAVRCCRATGAAIRITSVSTGSTIICCVNRSPCIDQRSATHTHGSCGDREGRTQG
jgi:acetyl-CoA C-acetyltransferase